MTMFSMTSIVQPASSLNLPIQTSTSGENRGLQTNVLYSIPRSEAQSVKVFIIIVQSLLFHLHNWNFGILYNTTHLAYLCHQIVDGNLDFRARRQRAVDANLSYKKSLWCCRSNYHVAAMLTANRSNDWKARCESCLSNSSVSRMITVHSFSEAFDNEMQFLCVYTVSSMLKLRYCCCHTSLCRDYEAKLRDQATKLDQMKNYVTEHSTPSSQIVKRQLQTAQSQVQVMSYTMLNKREFVTQHTCFLWALWQS